jgi:endo-1,4-beta-mannosidase
MYYVTGCGPSYSTGQIDQSMADIQAAGGNAIRTWFFEKQAYNGGSTVNWAPFDTVLNEAAKYGLRVIPTLGNQWSDCVNSGYKGLSWYQSGYRSSDGDGPVSYRDYVQQVVQRYANDPTVLMWQMMNEAEAGGGGCSESAAASALNAFATDIGGLIHGIDHNHLVNLGTIGSGQCGVSGSDYKTVYSSPGTDVCEYHDYNFDSTAMPSYLQNDLNYCAALGKPMFVGEGGIQRSVGLTTRYNDFLAKFNAQFPAGVNGYLIWQFGLGGGLDNYAVNPDDPVMTQGLLKAH